MLVAVSVGLGIASAARLRCGRRFGMSAVRDVADDAIRHVLDRVDETEFRAYPISDAVRRSWQRSASRGLTPESIRAPYDPDVDSDGRLRWAAAPAMAAVSADLPDMPIALLLTDHRVHVIERWAPTAHHAVLMDSIGAAPGFICAEDVVGTNSIGLAVHERGPAAVRGHEHYADALTHVSCAAEAITDPTSGAVLGVVSIVSSEHGCSDLLPALIGRVVHETRQRLFEDVAGSTTLHDAFLQARRRGRGPVAAVDAIALLANSAAGRIVAASDRAVLWEWAQRTEQDGDDEQVVLDSGPRRITCEPIRDGGRMIGALLWPESASAAPDALSSDWSRLTESERGVAECVASGLTNREAGATLFISPHTVDYHLRQIFRKLELDSRVELARLVERHKLTGS
jgi:DNA-binding CsgD family transcriptional regulator